MKTLLLILSLFISVTLSAQNFDNLHFGTDSTLEVMSWNLEGFPKNGTTTIQYLADIITSLEVDIVAIQELEESASFQELINLLPNHSGIIGSDNYQKLAYIYNHDVVNNVDSYEIYASEWSPFPRTPHVLEFWFQDEHYILINNHLKCCGDGIMNLNDTGDEETRRLIACNLLKSYVDNNFSQENVIIVGDWNDELDDELQNNVFQSFFDDSDHYLFTDYTIAIGPSANWSYPSWPSHLDHILITQPLFDDFEQNASSIEVLKIDECFSAWWQFDDYLSDHRPVALRLYHNSIISTDEFPTRLASSINPIPASNHITITMNLDNETASWKLYNLLGSLVQECIIDSNKHFIDLSSLPDGIYYYLITQENKSSESGKLLIIK